MPLGRAPMGCSSLLSASRHPSCRILEIFRFPRKEKPACFSLLECISVQDHDRFTNFIATSDVTAPSSLHLQMKDEGL